MLDNKSDVEKNASEQKCCRKVPVQNMGGVILDIDGTVLDSMSIWQDAGVRYLASQQIEAEPGLAEKIYYMSIPEAALYMRTRYGLEQSVEEISQGIKDVVRDFYYYEAPLKAGVKEFLQKMSDRKKRRRYLWFTGTDLYHIFSGITNMTNARTRDLRRCRSRKRRARCR